MYNWFIKNIFTTLARGQNELKGEFGREYFFGEVYEDYNVFLDWEKKASRLINRFGCRLFLDIGCGCGNLVKEVKRQVEDRLMSECNVRGVDVSNYAVNKAKVSFVTLADCRSLPFEDGCFDVVHILGTFSYLSSLADINQAVGEAYRVTRGAVVFDDV